MTDDLDPAGLAREIDAARERLISFVRHCTDSDWQAAPVEGDPRPVGVIADHVAHSYEYLSGWMGDLVAGRPVAVNAEMVDDLNAGHAGEAAQVTPEHVAGHLRASGDVIVELVAGLTSEQLDLEDGRLRLFARIAVRHADDHRNQICDALAGVG